MLICSMYAIFTYIQPRSIFKHSKDMDRSMSSYHILNRTWHLFQIDEHCWGGFRVLTNRQIIKEHITVDGKNPAAVEVGSLFHYLQRFFCIPGCAAFLPSTVCYMLLMLPSWELTYPPKMAF